MADHPIEQARATSGANHFRSPQATRFGRTIGSRSSLVPTNKRELGGGINHACGGSLVRLTERAWFDVRAIRRSSDCARLTSSLDKAKPYFMQDDDFEWDEARSAENFVHHGVSFEAARLAFDDVFAVAREDRRHDYGEDRFILLGMAGERLLAVAYTVRGARTRTISARVAEPQERRRYHEENR